VTERSEHGSGALRARKLGAVLNLGSGIVPMVAGLIALALVVLILIGMYWSAEPEAFDVESNAAAMAAERGQEVVNGSVTTLTLIQVAETLLHKPGGYLSNDLMPPGVWLDNMPNWEYGVLIQVRDLAKAMRESFSRSQSQSRENPDLTQAEPKFNFDSNSWVLPATESEYAEAVGYLEGYARTLADPGRTSAQFYSRSDNLRYWLNTVDARLGSLSQRLSASVGTKRLNTDLAGDAAARQATRTPSEIEAKTPWTEIDDVFYEARGTAWALIHLLKAVEVDFGDVLQKKNARVSLQQIIRELEATQETVWSPVILNGSGFGLFANHSLVMASYISRANAAIIDLRELLAQG